MKQIRVFLVLLLVISLLLVACGNKSNIESELIGVFEHIGPVASRTFTFYKDGTYHSVINFIYPQEESGTYVVKGDSIILTDTEGDSLELSYTYNSDKGELILYLNNGAYYKK